MPRWARCRGALWPLNDLRHFASRSLQQVQEIEEKGCMVVQLWNRGSSKVGEIKWRKGRLRKKTPMT